MEVLGYEELTRLARRITQINRWRAPYVGVTINRPGKLDTISAVIKYEEDYGSAEHSPLGVSLYINADIGMGWSGMWVLSFDPELMPASEEEFWAWVNGHIFIRYDSPETTVPLPDDPLSSMLYIPDALAATWILKPCPYLMPR